MSAPKKLGAAGAACSVMVIIGIVMSSGSVRTSERGLELIGNAESCRLEPYRCPANIWTDGIGNTHGVKPGVRKTQEQVASDWARNIREAEQCVNQFAGGAQLQQGPFDAAVSATFNMGCPTMQKSTMFWLFRQGRIADACQQFPRWVYSKGQKLPGLVTRRAAEQRLCLEGAK